MNESSFFYVLKSETMFDAVFHTVHTEIVLVMQSSEFMFFSSATYIDGN